MCLQVTMVRVPTRSAARRSWMTTRTPARPARLARQATTWPSTARRATAPPLHARLALPTTTTLPSRPAKAVALAFTYQQPPPGPARSMSAPLAPPMSALKERRNKAKKIREKEEEEKRERKNVREKWLGFWLRLADSGVRLLFFILSVCTHFNSDFLARTPCAQCSAG